MAILLTRPEPQNQRCCEQLQQQGHAVICAPMLRIEACEALGQLGHRLTQTSASEVIIAVSQHAIEAAQQALSLQGAIWPKQRLYLAVGQASAECWQQYGVKAQYPERQDSEGMLQLITSLNGITDALILRGQQGREWLAEQLRKRGIKVHYQCCYQRHFTHYTTEHLSHWQQRVDTIIATSGEIVRHLTNLSSLYDQDKWLKNCTLLLPSQRLIEYAHKLGFKHCVLSQGASTPALLSALSQLPASRNNHDQ